MLQLKYAHELIWNDLKYLETPRDALRTIERVHGSQFTNESIWHAHRHALPKFNTHTVHNGYNTIKNQLENGYVFLVNHSTQSPIIQTLGLKECGQEVDWALRNYVNDMMRNALRVTIERVEKPRSVGVLRSSPTQKASQNTNARQAPVREKHRILLEIESEDDRPLPAHHNVTLFVENTTKGRRAANQKHDVIDNQLSREFSAEKGDALKIYLIPSTQGAVLEDLKANSNVQQSESEGLISALTETGQEVEANGTILHHFSYKVPGKTTFKLMRIKQTLHTTISELTVEHDPSKKWYVLEAGGPDSKVSGKGRIEKGTYQLTPYSSSNYPNEFQLNQVPGRTNIIMYEYDPSKKLTTGLALGTSYDFSDDTKQYYKVDGSADAKSEIYDMIGDGEAEIVIESDLSLKILKDDLWVDDEHLNLVAGEMLSSVGNRVSPKASIKLVQEAFKKLNIPIIIDGDFGGRSREAWQFFQRYYPSANSVTDLSSEIDGDGLVLMDRAMCEGWVFEYEKPKWIDTAWGELGQKEIPGEESNTRIQEYYEYAGIKNAKNQNDDDIAWCACFVAWVMKKNGYNPVDNPAWSLNWRNFGVSLNEPKFGALAIKTRSNGGHIGYVVGQNGDGSILYILGGNQSDEVNVRKYKKSVFTDYVAPSDLVNSDVPLYIGNMNDSNNES